MILSGTTTPIQGWPGNNGNQVIPLILESPGTGVSSDGFSVGEGYYPSAKIQSLFPTIPTE